MSPSRRATGEINILAMLDGQAPGRRLRALPAVLRYGAAGVLACSLVVALAWLVRGATPARDAGTAGAAQASAGLSQAAQPTQASRTAPDSRDTDNPRDSLAVDVPSLRPALAVERPMSVPAPDMVASPAPAAGGAVVIDLPQPVAATESAIPVRARAGTETARAPAHHAVTHATSPSIPSVRPQPVLRTSSSQALAHADPSPPRQKRTTGAARATAPSATVDKDVALISAILQHTGTRNEAADGAGTATCADKPCRPRMPPRQ